MSEKYSKADLRHIAEDMIEDLRECEDGTITTTGRLARDYGYDDMETSICLIYMMHYSVLRRQIRLYWICLNMKAK